MKLGLVVFDILSLIVIASLWGLSIWSGVYVYHYLCASLWMPVALVIGCLAGVLTLIVQVGVLHRLLPRVRPGRYPMLKHPMFFIWVVRFILQRALFPPVLEVLLFQFNVLRFLSLRALGAKVSFGASMSSDVTVLDPWLLEVEDNATMGTGCLVSGHFVDRGQLILGTVKIGAGSLLAARVVVAPGTTIGKNVRVLAGAMIGTDVTIEDDVIVGADARIETHSVIEQGVTIGASTFLHKGVRLTRDTQPLEVIHPSID